MFTRRDLLKTAALACASLEAANFKGNLGVQLYTVRGVMPKDPSGTIKSISAIGYTEAEVSFDGLEKLLPILKDAKLMAVSCHLPTPILNGKWGNAKPVSWSEAIDLTQKAGLKFVCIPYIAPAERGKKLDDFREMADKLNKAGEQVGKAGMKLCYHNHAFEFAAMEGSRPIDILIEKTDAKLVGIELDVFWVSVAGNDPAAMLKKMPGRFPLVHLKDKKPDAPVQFAENVPRDTFMEVGNGSLDFKAILAAAKQSGVKHYFVEQDQTPGDPVESLKKSYANVRALRW
jgi:sugar phosphate isomerase/epimerase